MDDIDFVQEIQTEHSENDIICEAVDVVNYDIDIIYKYDNLITEEDLHILNYRKLKKWNETVK